MKELDGVGSMDEVSTSVDEHIVVTVDDAIEVVQEALVADEDEKLGSKAGEFVGDDDDD